MTKARFNQRTKELEFAMKVFGNAKRGIWPAGLSKELFIVWHEETVSAMNPYEVDQLIRDGIYFEAICSDFSEFDSVMVAEDFEEWRRCGEE